MPAPPAVSEAPAALPAAAPPREPPESRADLPAASPAPAAAPEPTAPREDPDPDLGRPVEARSVEAYWELRDAPFDNSPNPAFFYPAPGLQEALGRLEYAVKHRKGCAMLTAEYGCGKTLLIRALLQRLPRDRYDIGLVTNPCRNASEFLKEILYQLGVDTQERSKPRLLHVLNDLLYHNYRAGRDTVIVVDEAQLIEDEGIFEELRLLMNIQTDDRFLATVLLVGSPELRARLGRLEHVEQRIAIRCHLEPFDLAQTAAYIAHRLEIAGQKQRIFTDEAIRLVFELTGGAPRRINNLCDIALLIGSNELALEIDRSIVADSSRAPRRAAGEESWEPLPPRADSPRGSVSAGDAWLVDPPRAPWPHKYL